LRAEPHAIVVSARTGQGLDELWQRIDEVLPEPSVPIRTVIPYGRGDLVARMHSEGRVDSIEHNEDGSLVIGMAPPSLAAELRAVEASQAV
jgi:GTP-binding protein HflX